MLLTPPVRMTLERAIAYVADDELVEVTPKAIRLRKRHLDPQRSQAAFPATRCRLAAPAREPDYGADATIARSASTLTIASPIAPAASEYRLVADRSRAVGVIAPPRRGVMAPTRKTRPCRGAENYRGTLILLASGGAAHAAGFAIEGAIDDGARNRLRGSNGQRQRRQLHVLQSGIPGMGRPDRDPGRRHLGDAQDRGQKLERIDDLGTPISGGTHEDDVADNVVVPAFYAAVPLPAGVRLGLG